MRYARTARVTGKPRHQPFTRVWPAGFEQAGVSREGLVEMRQGLS